jgi:transcriptional regulator with PAS, ATPase and Fis domain
MTEIIASDIASTLGNMLEGFECPAILVSADYEILATNKRYQQAFGEIDLKRPHRCFEVSHGYNVPCDQAGEDCPLLAANESGHKERVLHIHQTKNGKEHVDVEMLPIYSDDGILYCFVELLRPVPLASGAVSKKKMVGISDAFTNMLGKIARVGDSDASVLLLGASGTGKELAAKAIHEASSRNEQPMVTLECSGLSDALFESELFGHVRGAFTGAHANKKGLVEYADGGSLFLDEIGDVPLAMQVKLLRLLESGTFRRVGSAQVKTSNFRLICATHKNIVQMVSDGSFRQDLYYRINVFPIHLPSLQERKEDIPLLCKTLLSQLSPDKPYHLTDSAVLLLSHQAYQGNIRELRNLLNRAIVLADTNVLDKSLIRECLIVDLERQGQGGITEVQAEKSAGWVDLKTAEKNYLSRLMQVFNEDKAKVASVAGISQRSLYRKLEGLELSE